MKTIVKDRLDLSLWFAQWTLAAAFWMSGLLKTCLPAELLTRLGLAAGSLAQRFGALELVLGFAVILPAATRLAPRLSVVAAAALGTLALVGLFAPHGMAGLGSPITSAALAMVALYAVWGRLAVAPIKPLEAEEDETAALGETGLAQSREGRPSIEEQAVRPARAQQGRARPGARRPPRELIGWDFGAAAVGGADLRARSSP